MNLREIARLILSESLLPLSARDVWAEAVRRGLDKQTGTTGKTPDATLGAYLYTASKKADSGIVAEGRKPTLFRFVGAKQSDGKPSVKQNAPAKMESTQKASKEQNSKFVGPCTEILSSHPGVAMGVNDILKAVLVAHPELPWKNSNGAVRAALLRAAKLGGTIRQVPGRAPAGVFLRSAKAQSASLPVSSSERISPLSHRVRRDSRLIYWLAFVIYSLCEHPEQPAQEPLQPPEAFDFLFSFIM